MKARIRLNQPLQESNYYNPEGDNRYHGSRAQQEMEDHLKMVFGDQSSPDGSEDKPAAEASNAMPVQPSNPKVDNGEHMAALSHSDRARYRAREANLARIKNGRL